MKRFTEVFPGLKTEEPVTSIMKDLEVERITVMQDMSRMTVYVSCREIIDRKWFCVLEID